MEKGGVFMTIDDFDLIEERDMSCVVIITLLRPPGETKKETTCFLHNYHAMVYCHGL